MSNPVLAGEAESGGGEPRARAGRPWTPLARALEATGDHWTLAIALALAPGRTRLTHLRERLPGVSTGVLERGLAQMVGLGLVSRERFKEKPPRVELELTDAGRELVSIAEALARWGMRRLWSEPRERERVDIGALLQLLPALLEEHAELPKGSLEAVLTDADEPVRCVYRVGDGRLYIQEGADHTDGAGATGDRDAVTAPASSARSASIRGDRDAWIAALGPAGDPGALRIMGEQALAQRVLDALPGSSTAVCHNGTRDRQRRDPQGA